MAPLMAQGPAVSGQPRPSLARYARLPGPEEWNVPSGELRQQRDAIVGDIDNTEVPGLVIGNKAVCLKVRYHAARPRRFV